MKSTPLLALTASAILTTALHAGTPTAPEPVMTTTTDNGWEITLGLYGWGAGLNGDIGAGGFTTPVDISFGDILDTLDMTAMGMMEARKGPWFAQLEGLYLRNSLTLTTYTPLRNTPAQAKLTAQTTRLELVGGYSVIDTDCTRLDLFAGAVYYDIDNELRLLGRRVVTSIGSGEGWLDPAIGFRLNQRLGGPWSAQLRGEVGGFGVSSDFLWQAVALIGYDLGESSTLFLGYRHAAVDYQKGGFLYDAASGGPILGLALTF
ncbi:conserved hypothetical protein [Haloferula helveola]|uniref:Outer membrane protein beta-barrel domain-containing protein n=1 Tax=Haloferula helveola TaxID=490095 RepID=A0ABM7RGC6_9BACT|nr:conserved hypothetical protein [Haloferula helveola]